MNARQSARSSETAHTKCSQITLSGKLCRPMGYEETDHVDTEPSELRGFIERSMKLLFSERKEHKSQVGSTKQEPSIRVTKVSHSTISPPPQT